MTTTALLRALAEVSRETSKRTRKTAPQQRTLTKLADHYAPRVRASLAHHYRQWLQPERLVRSYLDAHKLIHSVLRKQRDPDLTQAQIDWITAFSGDPGSMAEFDYNLRDIYGDAYGAGVLGAQEQLGQPTDWDTWTPGDPHAAIQAWGTDGGRGLRGMLEDRGIVMDGINQTTLAQIGTALGNGLNDGSSVANISQRIDSIIDDPQRAYTIAITESARAQTTAAVDEYRSSGVVAMVRWLAHDGACPECQDLEDEGPVPIEDSEEPPLHPNCGCALEPVIDTSDLSDGSDTSDSGDTGDTSDDLSGLDLSPEDLASADLTPDEAAGLQGAPSPTAIASNEALGYVWDPESGQFVDAAQQMTDASTLSPSVPPETTTPVIEGGTGAPPEAWQYDWHTPPETQSDVLPSTVPTPEPAIDAPMPESVTNPDGPTAIPQRDIGNEFAQQVVANADIGPLPDITGLSADDKALMDGERGTMRLAQLDAWKTGMQSQGLEVFEGVGNTTLEPNFVSLHEAAPQFKSITASRIADAMDASTQDIARAGGLMDLLDGTAPGGLVDTGSGWQYSAGGFEQYVIAAANGGELRVVASGSPEIEAAIREKAASDMIQNWAVSSNNENPLSLAIQQRAESMFGIDNAADWNITNSMDRAIKDVVDKRGDVIDSFLRAQYQVTQQALADQGVTELTMVRGFDFSYTPNGRPDWYQAVLDRSQPNPASGWERQMIQHDVPIELRPLSSFTTNARTASGFTGSGDSMVMTYATVPAERILGFPGVGFGCLEEHEFVVIGGKAAFTVVLGGAV